MIEDKRLQAFRSRIEGCKRKKRDLKHDWDLNISYRRGKPFDSDSDQDRVAVNMDFPFTKAKHASLFSQVPQVILTPKHPAFAQAAPVFAKALNDTLTTAKVGTAMDECLPDMINAAGIAGAIVAYDSITDMVQVPEIDPAMMPPELQQAVATGAFEIPMVDAQRTLDARFTVTRISPTDLLWPVEFKGSDFNDAPWVGRSGRMTWEEAKRTFGLTDEEHKERVVGDDRADRQAAHDKDHDRDADTEVVTFDEIYYWRHLYHADEKSFKAIQRVVFVNGLDDKPVVDEPWKGQRYSEQTGAYLGSCLFPIQFCTLTYITDEPVPPSDSAIGRPQVDELIKSRTQMVQQREHAKPIRWFDTNRVDPLVRDLLMKGEVQDFIPTNGSGDNVIGEVARAAHAQDDYTFDRVQKSDLQEEWGLGANQLGNFASGERSASEAAIVQTNTQTRNGAERARVVTFFVRIAEVMAGLMALYGEFDVPEELGASIGLDGQQRLASWNREEINQHFAFEVRADSSVLLTSEQRLERLSRFLNLTAKSGFVDVEPIVAEMAALSGLDPGQVVRRPSPQPPDAPKVALSLKGEDLFSPFAVGLLIKNGQAPTPEELQAAQRLLAASGVPTMPSPVAPQPPPGEFGKLPPSQPEPEVGSAHPQWEMLPMVNKRRDGEL